MSNATGPQTSTMPFWDVPRNVFFFVNYQQLGARPTIIFLDQVTSLSKWIDDTFAEFTGRLVSTPDQDLLDVARHVTFTESGEITDEWIEFDIRELGSATRLTNV